MKHVVKLVNKWVIVVMWFQAGILFLIQVSLLPEESAEKRTDS